MSLAKAEYFLGCVSPTGFQTHFNNEIAKSGNFTYILKGGAGTGKSSLMKRIAKDFSDKDAVTVYYCSSDPDSLDAVILKNAGVIIVDGTSPHVFDPIYAGVTQKIINLGDFWDDELLSINMTEIIKVTDENQRWHKRCRSFISAMSSLYSDTYSISQESINYEKLDAFTSRLAHKIIPKGKTEEGITNYSQISALTPKGYLSLLNTISEYKNVYTLNDCYYSGSDIFLRDFATVATNRGYDVIISESTLFQTKTYEHLLIPELGVAFISSNPMNNINNINSKSINFLRFYDKTFLLQKKARLLFNKKACEDLIEEAASALLCAKTVHDDIESFYIKAMDFDKVNTITDSIIKEIMLKYADGNFS